MATYPSKIGFSLVELSIVLVILGLLTGGILGGQALMRAAELRAVLSEINTYTVAAHTFKDKYFALPGDMPNAVKFWGAAAGGTANGEDATCIALDYTSPSTGSETCNGDGNGQVEPNNEMMRFWQHLANADLIAGKYTGVSFSGASNRAHMPGINCPGSKFPTGGFSYYYIAPIGSGHIFLFEGDYGNSLIFGKPSTSYETVNPIFTPEEAWGMDTKLDDSKPGLGKLRTRNAAWQPNCTTSDDPVTSVYKLDISSAACSIYILNGL